MKKTIIFSILCIALTMSASAQKNKTAPATAADIEKANNLKNYIKKQREANDSLAKAVNVLTKSKDSLSRAYFTLDSKKTDDALMYSGQVKSLGATVGDLSRKADSLETAMSYATDSLNRTINKISFEKTNQLNTYTVTTSRIADSAKTVAFREKHRADSLSQSISDTLHATFTPNLALPLIDYRMCNTDSACKQSLEDLLAKTPTEADVATGDGDAIKKMMEFNNAISRLDPRTVADYHAALADEDQLMHSRKSTKLGTRLKYRRRQMIVHLTMTKLKDRARFIVNNSSEWKKYGTQESVKSTLGKVLSYHV